MNYSNLLFSRPTDTVRLDWLGRVAKNQDEAIGINWYWSFS